jgi:hypothetical protein
MKLSHEEYEALVEVCCAYGDESDVRAIIAEVFRTLDARPRRARRGNPNIAAALVVGNARRREAAVAYAEMVAPAIREARAAGAKSLREIAAVLNGRGVKSPHGAQWRAQTVATALARVGER